MFADVRTRPDDTRTINAAIMISASRLTPVEESTDQLDRPLRLLIVEDSRDDADLLLSAVLRGGFGVTHEVVDNSPAMRAALERQDWDVITSDVSMPRFSAPAAMALARELRPHVPVFIVSGETDVDDAVTLIRDGARDFIQKHELPRLVPAIERTMRETQARLEYGAALARWLQ